MKLHLTRKGRIEADRRDVHGVPVLVSAWCDHASAGRWVEALGCGMQLRIRGQEITDLPMLGIGLHLIDLSRTKEVQPLDVLRDLFTALQQRAEADQ
jgi:hypothetical protein